MTTTNVQVTTQTHEPVTMIKQIDPTDSMYQLDPAFKPDKERTWNHPMETDGWVQAHDSLRREMKLMVKALKAHQSRKKGLVPWEVSCVQQFWMAHYEHIHAHHSNEDDIMVPFCKTRFRYPEKTVTDHDGLVATLDKLNGMVKALKAGDTVEAVAEAMVAYQADMVPHLKEEEDECLPLLRAYFTPKEVGPQVQKILANGPKHEVGSLIACMGTETWRKEFMPQEGIPGFVWFIDFKGRLKAFMDRFQYPVEAITTGVAPEASGKCCA